MQGSFQAFMEKIIDYAGLFPPAQLPMDQAIGNYLKYRQSDDAWMLSRFIVPASRLPELAPLLEGRLSAEQPLPLSVLTRNGESSEEFFANLEKDFGDISNFSETFGEAVRIEMLEARFPAEIFRDISLLPALKFLNGAGERIEASGLPAVRPFFEGSLQHDDWRADNSLLIDALAAFNRGLKDQRPKSGCLPAGFKLRCGGKTAADVPSAEQAAFILADCRRAGIPFKATAGLHHPLRQSDETPETKLHGFINVFAAGILADRHGLRAKDLQPLVKSENAADFDFSGETLQWNGYRAGVEDIRKARREAVISFGSCSFDEPRQDLRALGLL